MNSSDWFNTKTLRAEFGIAESTQAKYRKNKNIPYTKIGGFIFYSRAKIYEWLDKNNLEAADGA